MTISPETLLPETEEERRVRENRTGVLRNGLNVLCFPNPEDPMVFQTQHRAACGHRPYAACPTCPHSTYTLAFKKDTRDEKYSLVSCPRWETEFARSEGQAPTGYVFTEVATCRLKPFTFCMSCPSKEDLQEVGADKTKPGWVGRWKRLRGPEDDDDD
jgi:hypothetical protein